MIGLTQIASANCLCIEVPSALRSGAASWGHAVCESLASQCLTLHFCRLRSCASWMGF